MFGQELYESISLFFRSLVDALFNAVVNSWTFLLTGEL